MVVAVIVLPYSQARTEDRANKLKVIKRSMYGGGKFDLLLDSICWALLRAEHSCSFERT